MYSLLVQADAIHTGKFVHQLRRGLSAVIAHDYGAYFVEFSRSDAGSYRPLHCFEHAAHNRARSAHAGKFVRTGDGHNPPYKRRSSSLIVLSDWRKESAFLIAEIGAG